MYESKFWYYIIWPCYLRALYIPFKLFNILQRDFILRVYPLMFNLINENDVQQNIENVSISPFFLLCLSYSHLMFILYTSITLINSPLPPLNLPLTPLNPHLTPPSTPSVDWRWRRVCQETHLHSDHHYTSASFYLTSSLTPHYHPLNRPLTPPINTLSWLEMKMYLPRD